VRKPQVVPDEDHEVMYERVAAVDVAKASGVVCLRTPDPGRPGRFTNRIWDDVPATRARIAEVGRELLGCRVQMVTLESTSDYWRIWLRREASCCIPGLAGRNLEDIPGSDGLLKIRKVKGTIACQETSGRAKAYGRGAGGPARYG
jgi:transposase